MLAAEPLYESLWVKTPRLGLYERALKSYRSGVPAADSRIRPWYRHATAAPAAE